LYSLGARGTFSFFSPLDAFLVIVFFAGLAFSADFLGDAFDFFGGMLGRKTTELQIPK
jgi:hypothetical protein